MSSLNDYSVAWSDSLIARVETHLRDVHSAVHQYYEKEGYPTSIETKSAAAGNDDNTNNTTEEESSTHAAIPATATTTSLLDVVSPAGSFLLRTCVHATPFGNVHAERGVGADLVVTMPAAKCSQAELQDGLYLERRQAFVLEMEAYLNKLVHGAAKKMADNDDDEADNNKMKGGKRTRGENESDDDEDEDEGSNKGASNMAAAERLARMVVVRMPIHGCYANGEKEMLRLRFRRRNLVGKATIAGGNDANTNTTNTSGLQLRPTYETFYIDLHFRPEQHSGRITSAAAVRKHPYYSYLSLEDSMMPVYLQRIHRMCVEADSLRRALVVLKCWAHHTGLMAAASGHHEGLSGFLLACMLLRLKEDGVVSGLTSEENAARAVWIRLSQGFFLPGPTGKSGSGGMIVPAAEERGEVAVLRLQGEVMNVLFRSSAAFFRSVVQRAAEEALTHPIASEVFSRTPFQMLQLRYDVALTIRDALPTPASNDNSEEKDSGDSIRRDAESVKKGSVFVSPIAKRVRDVCAATLTTALTHRAAFLSVWPTSATTMQVIIQLTNEAEGRNHLTRGPAIEETEAVATFNAFWGPARTSTRQFSDGAIYRCVLWAFPEAIVGNCATAALPAGVVLRKVCEAALRLHASPVAAVSVLLGGLDGLLAERIGAEWRDASQVAQRSLREASVAVQKAMADLPRTVLPCKITEFCVIAASERGTEVFPVRPHLALTRSTEPLDSASERYAGLSTAPTIEPVHCVMAIDDKGKIPDTLEAIGLMKGAICAQLAKYIQQHHSSANTNKGKSGSGSGSGSNTGEPPAVITAFASSQYVDLICQGYLFRVYVAHYREVSLLRALQREAEANTLEQKLFWTTQHAKFISSIVYGHHSYAGAARLAKRWVSAMMLYEFISSEAIELLVANAYLSEVGSSTSTSTTGNTSMVMGAPRTAAGGFLRFIQLVASHDWARVPLVLPFTDDEKDPATAARRLMRKPAAYQALYIATPYAPTESPFTFNTPRPMILHRLVQLAKGVLSIAMAHLAPRGCFALTHVNGGAGGGGESTLERLYAAAEGVCCGAVAAAARCVVCAGVERTLFTSSPAAFDFAMAFHPQLIIQPDRYVAARGPASHSSATSSSLGHQTGEAGAGAEAEADTTEGKKSASSGGVDVIDTVAAKPVVRIRQLDELDKEQSREYVSALVEREPAAHAVRTIRAALRDQGMVFYDALAPAAIHVVGVSAIPMPKRNLAMHDDILRVGRGALLAAPRRSFFAAARASSSSSAANAKAKATGGSSNNARRKAAAATAGGLRAADMDATDAQSLMTATAQMGEERGNKARQTRAATAKQHKKQQQQQQQQGEGTEDKKEKEKDEKPAAAAEDGGAAAKKKARTEQAAVPVKPKKTAAMAKKK